MNILNVHTFDPFKDAGEDHLDIKGQFIHIRVQQRNNRKRLTTIQGVPDTVDIRVLLKRLRKILSCNGCIVEHNEYGNVIQLQGDKRDGVANYLILKKIGTNDTIHIHGV